MPPKSAPYTFGSTSFEPDLFIKQWNLDLVPKSEGNDLNGCIQKAFGLKNTDDYVYHAIASVTLQQVQSAVNAGSRNGMHAWYKDGQGKPVSSVLSDL
jgi:hypothetical protein